VSAVLSRIHWLLAAATSLILVGCNSPRHVALTLTAADNYRPAPVPAAANQVVARFTPAKDCRLDRTSLGAVGGNIFDTGEVLSWLDQSFQTLGTAHWKAASQDPTTGAPVVTIHPSLLKLYVDSVSVSKTAVIVIQLDFELPGDKTAQQIYRGQYAGMNWASGTGEVTSSLHHALDDCLLKINQSMEVWLPQLKPITAEKPNPKASSHPSATSQDAKPPAAMTTG